MTALFQIIHWSFCKQFHVGITFFPYQSIHTWIRLTSQLSRVNASMAPSRPWVDDAPAEWSHDVIHWNGSQRGLRIKITVVIVNGVAVACVMRRAQKLSSHFDQRRAGVDVSAGSSSYFFRTSASFFPPPCPPSVLSRFPWLRSFHSSTQFMYSEQIELFT